MRTNILICVGAVLITDVSTRIGLVNGVRVGGPARLAAQIVSGIGFIGAGTIMQGGGVVTGLTTAATIWVVAALGIAIGGGFYIEAAGTGALVTIVLAWLGRVEHKIRRIRRTLHLTVQCGPGTSIAALRDTLAVEGLTIIAYESFEHPD